MALKLYAWQEECLAKWFQNNCRGIVNVVTGAGKTVLAMAAAARLSGLPGMGGLKVYIVVPKAFLAGQWERALRGYLSVPRADIGEYSGARKSGLGRKYMIYVVNSARYSLARHITGDFADSLPVLLIADECHHYGTDENRKIFGFYPYMNDDTRFYALGLSATPYCEHYDDVLVPRLGPEIYRFSFNSALMAGIINPFAVFHIRLRFADYERADYNTYTDQIAYSLIKLRKAYPNLRARDTPAFFARLRQLADNGKDAEMAELARSVMVLSYQRKAVVYNAGARVWCVIDLVKLIREDAKIIIFGERIERADEIFDALNKIYPGKVGLYHSGAHKSSSEAAVKRFEDGGVRILVSCRTLDEGLSVTDADAGIIVSSAGAARQRVQRLGRILRKKGTGRLAYFYYLYIEDTMEETDLLSEHLAGLERLVSMIDLDYDDAAGEFSNSYYDVLAGAVYARVSGAGWSGEALAELVRNFRKGVVAGDWLVGEGECMERIRSAGNRATRNYYTAMMYLIREMRK